MKIGIIYITYVLLIFVCNSCIEEYKPLIDVKDHGNYVVYGNITNQEGYQTIKVSRAIGLRETEKDPVTDCNVVISDNKGNSFSCVETNPGEYKAWIDGQFLNVLTSYKVDITTLNGDEITSDYSEMTACADIDSIYYKIQDIPTSDREHPIKGIQFYTNYSGTNDQSRYYKYSIEETWEYHTKYLNHGYYDGEIHVFDPPDESLHVCWKTYLVPRIIVLSTARLSENKYNEFPLQYVRASTDKLIIGFSVLIRQESLTQKAYYYWNKIKKNTNETGGLYTTQPELIQGNLYNLTDPNAKVLGYFSASSVKSVRIFLENIEGLKFAANYHCTTIELMGGPSYVNPMHWPFYIAGGGGVWLTDECVDCTIRGGTTTKPDFWPY